MQLTAGQSHTKPIHQRIAILTTLIFLWLSAGATLTHTDSCFENFAPIRSAPHNCTHPASGVPEEILPCAACEWTAIHVLTPGVFVLSFTLLLIREQRAVRLTDAVRRLVTYASLRAPPCLL